MHITITIGTLQGGGAERVVTTLADAWLDRGHRVSIITFEKTDATPAYPLSRDVKVIRLNLNTPTKSKLGALVRVWNSIRTLRKTIHSLRPDVVISFIDQVNTMTVPACIGLNLPVIISERVHPGHYKISWFWNLLRRLFYPLATALVVQTADISQWCGKRFGIPIYIIPNPIRKPKRLRTPSTQKRSTIVAAGRLMHQKGFDILIKAFAQLADEFPTWGVIIYGEGRERAALENLIRATKLHKRILLPGWTPTLSEEFRKADAFCLSSRFEGFPNVLCEAMSIGLPVVSTDCPSGPSDIIKDGENGILVPTDDPDALADGLRIIMADKSLRLHLGTNATAISERFSLETVLDQWQQCLDRYTR